MRIRLDGLSEHSRPRRVLMLAGTLMAIAGVTATPAASAPTTKVVATAGEGEFLAPCPPGRVATGGGAGAANLLGRGGLARSEPVFNSRGVPRKWKANLNFHSGSLNGWAYAICGKASKYRKLRVRSRYGAGTIQKSCNRNEVALGGGAGVDIPGSPTFAYLSRSQPVANARKVPKAWKASLRDAAGPATGTVYVVCQKRSAAPRLRVRRVSDRDSFGWFVVNCRKREVATGGGAGTTDTATGWLGISEPQASAKRKAIGWKAVIPKGAPGAAYVICAR